MTIVLYIISAIFCLIALTNLAPSRSCFFWFPVAVGIEFGIGLMTAYIFSLCKIGFNIWFIAISNFLLGIIAVLYARKHPRIGIPIFFKDELILYIIAILTACLCIYGLAGYTLSYAYPGAADASAHISYMVNIADGGIVGAMNSSHVWDACILTCFKPFFTKVYYYQVFEIAEITLFLFGNLTFISLLNAYAPKLNIVVKITLLLLYSFGYPLTQQAYGWSYLGLGITSFGLVLFLCKAINPEELFNPFNVFILNITLYLAAVAYPVFMPPTYIGFFIYVIYCLQLNSYELHTSRKVAQKVQIIKRSLISVCKVFLFPFILALITTLKQFLNPAIFGSGGVNVTTGGTYLQIFANFIFILPLAIFGAIYNKKIHTKCMSGLDFVCFTFVLYTLIILFCCIFKVASHYWIAKLHFIIWLILFTYAAIGIERMVNISKRAMLSYALCWFAILFVSVTKLDTTLSIKRPNLNPIPVSNTLFDNYNFNLSRFRYGAPCSIDDFIADVPIIDKLTKNGSSVELIARNEIIPRFYVTNIEDESDAQVYPWWIKSSNEIINHLKEYDYVVIVASEDWPEFNTTDKKSFDELYSMIYSNETELVASGRSILVIKGSNIAENS